MKTKQVYSLQSPEGLVLAVFTTIKAAARYASKLKNPNEWRVVPLQLNPPFNED